MTTPGTFITILILLSATTCSSYAERKTIEIKRGALSCVKEIGYGPGGTHGGKGWVRLRFDIFVNGKKWLPAEKEDFIENVATCESSPDRDIEVLKLLNVGYDTGGTYLIRMKDGEPALQKITQKYETNDQGEWTNDPRWLLFQEYLVNIETGERRDIKRLPETPHHDFLGVSPDLKTIVYLECGWLELNQNSNKQWKKWQDNADKGILALWLIDAETGSVEVVDLKRDDYRWLLDNSHPIPEVGANHLWISNQFKWKKDAAGLFRLEYPK